MLIVNYAHLHLAGVASLEERCCYCSRPLAAYPLILSDDAGQSASGPSTPLRANERRRALNREKRYQRYVAVKALRAQGLSHYAIADALGLSRPTVRYFLKAQHFPERRDQPKDRQQSRATLLNSSAWPRVCNRMLLLLPRPVRFLGIKVRSRGRSIGSNV